MPTTEPVVITNHVTDSDFLVSACLLALASNVDAKTPFGRLSTRT